MLKFKSSRRCQPGTDILQCLLLWPEQNDAVHQKLEEGPQTWKKVYTWQVKERKQNTGIVFCKSQIHVLFAFFFFLKTKNWSIKKRRRKARATGRAQETDSSPLPTPLPPLALASWGEVPWPGIGLEVAS